MADSVAATFAAMAAMFAVYQRDQGGGGRGQEIDVSLYEPLFRLVEAQVIGFDQLGIVKTRQGNRLAEDSPRNIYETRDGRWVGISASSQRTFERLVETMGRPELATDPRYANNVTRCAHADELDALIAEWFGTRSSRGDAAVRSRGCRSRARPDIRDIMTDPHYQARENIVGSRTAISAPYACRAWLPASRARRVACSTRAAISAPTTAEVLAKIGIGPDEQRRLAATGVI